MSDDFDDFDSGCWEQVDAITTQAYSDTNKAAPPLTSTTNDKSLSNAEHSVRDEVRGTVDDSYSDDFDIMILDDNALEELDKLEGASSQAAWQPYQWKAGNTSTSAQTRQTTLFGTTLPDRTSAKGQQGLQPRVTQRAAPQANTSGPPTTKEWDFAGYKGWAATGEKEKRKGKGRELHGRDNDDEEEEEHFNEEFEQFPSVQIKHNRPSQMQLKPDLLAARKWIYPVDRPKRDYQFNIVRHALFKNCLVALPTGLGKTFIAAVVMLNYYHWFPEGKIVFVAPTKPLVSQQVEACHGICGIPQEQSVVMTGELQQGKRVKNWIEKRVFFMTPQTLANDLRSENCLATDIVLLVIDEAHRGTGNYAYAEVVRFLMHKNPFFRVLALTATPGNNMEKVQAIVDALHIGHIEIRNEQSLDIRQYVHKKEIKKYFIDPTEEIDEISDSLAKLMESTHDKIRRLGILHVYKGYKLLHPFQCQKLLVHPDMKKNPWAYSSLVSLMTYARAMGALLEGSVDMCRNILQGMLNDSPDTGRKANSAAKSLTADPKFQQVMQLLDRLCANGPVVHPKMDCIKRIALEHFTPQDDSAAMPDGAESSAATRMMIFAQFREYVDGLVEYLNKESPIIRATRFVGQGTDKKGGKGMRQKEQQKTLDDFKAGVHNVLVATSVGEEGLDIGEVEAIAFYDTGKDSIRCLQRAGRTGRKKQGCVHVLMAKDREDSNWTAALDAYQGVQANIVQGRGVEVYGDGERLLPPHIEPELVEMKLDAQPYIREQPSAIRRRAGSTAGTKRKRNTDPSRNIPDGASTGFLTASKLTSKKGSKAKPKMSRRDKEKLLEDSDDDETEFKTVLNFKRRKTDISSPKASATITKLRPFKSQPAANPAVIDVSDESDVEPVPVPPPSRTPPASSSLRDAQRSTSLQANLHPEFASPKSVQQSSVVSAVCSVSGTPDRAADNSWLLDSPLLERSTPRPHSPCLPTANRISPHNTSYSPISPPRGFQQSPSHATTSTSWRTALPEEVQSSEGRYEWPRATQPVRGFGQRRKHRPTVPATDSSPIPDSSASRRIRKEMRVPLRTRPNNHTETLQTVYRSNAHMCIDDEASVSGSDISSDEPDVEEEETPEDRLFTTALPETQVPLGYAQTQAYRQSLLTQAGHRGDLPDFSSRGSKHPRFVRRETNKRREGVSSSPPRTSDPDFYEHDSFLVADDDDVMM